MRELTEHRTNAANRGIAIEVVEDDEGNPREYDISRADGEQHFATLVFQRGPIVEGLNGITIEVLLAIAADQLRYFQQTKFNCVENMVALNAVKGSLAALNARTRRRTEQGIEGTHEPDPK